VGEIEQSSLKEINDVQTRTSQLNSTPKLDPAHDQAWLIGLFKQKNST
jgi:hypothetical protein